MQASQIVQPVQKAGVTENGKAVPFPDQKYLALLDTQTGEWAQVLNIMQDPDTVLKRTIATTPLLKDATRFHPFNKNGMESLRWSLGLEDRERYWIYEITDGESARLLTPPKVRHAA